MKPQKQKFSHIPEAGVYGDCHRTALACLLDMDRDDVPHLLHDNCDGPEFCRRETEFLNSVGYHKAVTCFASDSLEQVLNTQRVMNPGVYYLLGGQTERGTDHTVICCGGEMVWDPDHSNSFVCGPMVNEEPGNRFNYFSITYLLPIGMLKNEPVEVR